MIGFSALTGIKDLFGAFWHDIKIVFTKEVITNNHYLHFFLTLPIAFILTYGTCHFFHLDDTNVFFASLIGGGYGLSINFARENMLEDQEQGVPFDWCDVRFGAYAGLIAGAVAFLLY